MADNGRNYEKKGMGKIVTTQLYSKVFWNDKDQTKTKRFEIILFNNSVQFVITQMGPDKKFSGQRVAATIGYLSPAAVMNVAKEMQRRMVKIIEKGEVQDKEALILYSGRNLKDATSKVEFNIFSQAENSEFKSAFSGYIKVTNKKDDKVDENIIWLGGAKNLYRGTQSDKKPARDFEVYEMFQEIASLFESIMGRYSLSRDNHMRKYLDSVYGNNTDQSNNNNQQQQYQGKPSSDDEDYPY